MLSLKKSLLLGFITLFCCNITVISGANAHISEKHEAGQREVSARPLCEQSLGAQLPVSSRLFLPSEQKQSRRLKGVELAPDLPKRESIEKLVAMSESILSDRGSDRLTRTIVVRLRSRLYQALTGTFERAEFIQRLASVQGLFEAYLRISRLGAEWQETAPHQRQAELSAIKLWMSLLGRAEYEPLFARLGSTFKSLRGEFSVEVLSLLMVDYARMMTRVDVKTKEQLLETIVTTLELDFATDRRPGWDEIVHVLGSRVEKVVQSYVKTQVANSKYTWVQPKWRKIYISVDIFMPSKKGRQILKHLENAKWFSEKTRLEQKRILFILSRASHVAEKTSSEMQRNLLNRTIELILRNNITINVARLQKCIHGTACSLKNLIEINSSRFRSATLFEIIRSLDGPALETLPHEVNHILSGQDTEPHVRYFEEELMAEAVSIVGLKGRPPNKRELGAVALNLIQSNSYKDIVQAWRAAPETFFPYLTALGFNTSLLGGLSHRARHSVLTVQQSILSREPAPVWGWPGRLENQPPNPPRH